MLLVETELTSLLAFRSASGNCSRMHTLGKVRQAPTASVAVLYDPAHLHTCKLACVHASRHTSPRDRNNMAALPLSRAMAVHSRIGRTSQTKDHVLSVFRKSCCVFRKHSPSPVTFLPNTPWGCQFFTVDYRRAQCRKAGWVPSMLQGLPLELTFPPPPANCPPLWGWSRA